MEIGIFIMLFGLFFVASAIESKIKRAERRTARVERKLDLIIEHLGVDAGGLMPNLAPVHIFLAQGERMKAIKEYRKITGVGLKEAVDEIQRLTDTHR
ncbi:hypothetical protein [Streptomyces cavernicola]|uniref:Ribosomal protein L7/L12 C-terminal domain-containing protein n=1 Tax=Streptomyces cavernicola TaxID=3043613 RepID=A0ABT6S777_9ACTN|nr:hypothetical protein [Streptomyces sp. B-S-A6]MDI3403734.1 hypothetical protein [Streptomyces sp. B-S-A6]